MKNFGWQNYIFTAMSDTGTLLLLNSLLIIITINNPEYMQTEEMMQENNQFILKRKLRALRKIPRVLKDSA